jgi:hypothetical protein
MDGASQVRHVAALAIRAGTWLRDEEANLRKRQPPLDGEVASGQLGR